MNHSPASPQPPNGPQRDPLRGLRAAWDRLQASVQQERSEQAKEAVLDFASEACFAMRRRRAQGPPTAHEVGLIAYYNVELLMGECCSLAGDGGDQRVHVGATEDTVSGTLLFERTAPDPAQTTTVVLRDGARHEALQFAARVLGAWTQLLSEPGGAAETLN